MAAIARCLKKLVDRASTGILDKPAFSCGSYVCSQLKFEYIMPSNKVETGHRWLVTILV